MGLLTNPDSRKKVVSAISKYNNKLCFLCYIAGVVWFLGLAYKPWNAGTYFSENALLPGLVTDQFYAETDANNYYEEIKNEMKKDKRAMPVSFLQEKFLQLGLESYVQNYTFKYPLKIVGEQSIPGHNVYAILRAPRAASTEAVVITVPFRPPASPLTKTTGGLALVLAVAKFCRKYTFWSKDIIFVVTEHEGIGMQAWLDGYHNTKSDLIYAGNLQSHSGSIQAAISLEIPTNKISEFDLRLQGLNGQMPNLDLVNLVVKMCNKEGIKTVLHKQADPRDSETWEGYQQSLKTMLLMMWNQAPGIAQGNHGLFLRYHIEALTLVGRKMKGAHRTYGFGDMGRVVEGILRSLNNLLERFHQSFFFYVLPETHRYVSIGLYMPPFGLIAVGALIKAVALWIGSGEDKETEQKEESQDSTEKREKEDKKDSGENKNGSKKEENQTLPLGRLVRLFPVCFMAQLFGIMAYYCPDFFVDIGQPMRMQVQDSLQFGILSLSLSALSLPRLLKRSLSDKNTPEWGLLKSVALMHLGLVLASTALMNISLAFFLAVVMVPVCVMVRPVKNRLVHLLQCILLLLISPFMLLYIATIINNIIAKNSTDIVAVIQESWTEMATPLLYSVIDYQLHGNWVFAMVTFAIFPNWLLFWTLIWSRVE